MSHDGWRSRRSPQDRSLSYRPRGGKQSLKLKVNSESGADSTIGFHCWVCTILAWDLSLCCAVGNFPMALSSDIGLNVVAFHNQVSATFACGEFNKTIDGESSSGSHHLTPPWTVSRRGRCVRDVAVHRRMIVECSKTMEAFLWFPRRMLSG